LWEHVLAATEFLGLDFVEMKLFEQNGDTPVGEPYLWQSKNGCVDPRTLDSGRTMFISLPLSDGDRRLGLLCLAKDLVKSPMTPFTLRRIEQLRRAVLDALLKVPSNGPAPSAPLPSTSRPGL
jgi:hypothetical protein